MVFYKARQRDLLSAVANRRSELYGLPHNLPRKASKASLPRPRSLRDICSPEPLWPPHSEISESLFRRAHLTDAVDALLPDVSILVSRGTPSAGK